MPSGSSRCRRCCGCASCTTVSFWVLSLAAYQTVKELMAAAVEEKGFRPGVVSVVQTLGKGAKSHPHVHALVSRSGWTPSGDWVPVPYVDEGAAERLFRRHKMLARLRRRGLLSQERIDWLLSRRRSGFSVHNRVFVHPRDGREFEALVRQMMRPPVSRYRLHFTPGSHEVAYVPKGGHDRHRTVELRVRGPIDLAHAPGANGGGNAVMRGATGRSGANPSRSARENGRH